MDRNHPDSQRTLSAAHVRQVDTLNSELLRYMDAVKEANREISQLRQKLERLEAEQDG